VRSSGTTDALQQIGPVVQALADSDMVVDMTVEGLQHAPERAGVFAGDTRLIYISDEHPELLERTKPDPAMKDKVALAIQMLTEAREMRVTSPAGTDLVIRKEGVRAGGHWGPCETPRSRGMWPSGIVACYPPQGSVNGTLVLDRGDMNLTFKRYLERPVTLHIQDDFVRDVAGDGLDADLTRSYFEAWQDDTAYATSHVGWGMNPGARWDAMVMYDKAQHNGVEQRAFAGNFLYSTGANEAIERYTLGHFDLPVRNCTITLDGVKVVDAGALCEPLAYI
jgi:2,5-dihydroxypyridine 5,6-dioxygenase